MFTKVTLALGCPNTTLLNMAVHSRSTRHRCAHQSVLFLAIYVFYAHFLRISVYNSTPLKVGMTVSNGTCFLRAAAACAHHASTEPGFYADGRFGIRIENVVVVRKAKTPNNFGDKGYLGFEHVTMVPSLLLNLPARLLNTVLNRAPCTRTSSMFRCSRPQNARGWTRTTKRCWRRCRHSSRTIVVLYLG